MKATSRLSQYRSKPIVLLDKYKVKPKNHDSYKWIMQDLKVIPVKKIDDNHLMNIYKMLERSLSCSYSLTDSLLSVPLQGEMAMMHQDQMIGDTIDSQMYIELQISHIGYEIYKRGLLINQFEKYKILPDEDSRF